MISAMRNTVDVRAKAVIYLSQLLSILLRSRFFIFLIALLSAFLIEGIGEKNLSTFLQDKSVIGVFLSALIGLIPNCGSFCSDHYIISKGAY